MKKLFSLTLYAFLVATGMSAIIVTESLPSVIQISHNKFIITIDESSEVASKATSSMTKYFTGQPKSQSTGASSIDHSKPAANKPEASSSLSVHSQSMPHNTVGSQVITQNIPQSSSNKNIVAQSNSSGIVTLNSHSKTSQSIIAQTSSKDVQTSNQVHENKKLSSISLSQNENPLNANTTTMTQVAAPAFPFANAKPPVIALETTSTPTPTPSSTSTPTLGLTLSKPASPLIGLANPISKSS